MERIIQTVGGLAAIGALVGVGQLLLSKDKLTLRLALGRAITSGGLGASAAAVMVWLPDLPPVAIAGLAAALSSLGTTGLERLLQKYLGGRTAPTQE